jgi:hypothetical protein
LDLSQEEIKNLYNPRRSRREAPGREAPIRKRKKIMTDPTVTLYIVSNHIYLEGKDVRVHERPSRPTVYDQTFSRTIMKPVEKEAANYEPYVYMKYEKRL